MGHLYRFVEPVVLLMLGQKPCHGYQLSTQLSTYSFTDAEVERAALYRTLRRLEKRGYVRSDWKVDQAGPARRIYSLTRPGETHLQEWAQVLAKVSRSMSRFVELAKRRRTERNARRGELSSRMPSKSGRVGKIKETV
jgi:PadR family transcriptional regulator, regulatory protein PadR